MGEAHRQRTFIGTDIPSAMTQSVRQEHGTSRISSKSGRSMRCTEGSSQHTSLQRSFSAKSGNIDLSSEVVLLKLLDRLSNGNMFLRLYKPPGHAIPTFGSY